MSAFSGREGRLAALMNALTAQQTQQAIDSRLNAGQTFATQALDSAVPSQLGALANGYSTARGDYDQAIAGYKPYVDQGLTAWNAQGDAAGLNGAEGYDRATAAFRASPGYQWQVDQATDQTARGAAASGQLLSGNAVAEMQDRASHLADQEYGTYYDRLRGIADTGYNATGAQAGLRAGEGGLDYGYGGDVAGVYGNTAQAKAGLYENTAVAGANALSNTGNKLIDANNAAAKAGQDASTNRLTLGTGIANALVGLAGRYVGSPSGSAAVSKYIG